MKWYEAVVEMFKDPTKQFKTCGWTWQVMGGNLKACCDAYAQWVPANISSSDQLQDWTLVIPSPKEYTFNEMVKELLKLGNKYYAICTNKSISTDRLTVSGYPNADCSFLYSLDYSKTFTDFITNENLRFHIKPKE